jgi:hypothetical protein
MTKVRILLAALFLAAQCAAAADSPWHTPDGKPVPDSDAMKGANGFGASLVLTPDADWQAKWNTPPDTAPRFRTTSRVKVGEKVTLLIFILNPKVGANGEVDVRCDIAIRKPDGSVATAEKDLACLRGALQGDPRHVRLAVPVVAFEGEASDPLGQWRVEVSVKDALRDTTLPLKVLFTLLRGEK